MADDLSLLFRLRADNAQAKTTIAETKAAVASLRQSFGPELTQTISVANKAFSEIGNNLNVFVGQRIPLAGGAFLRVTENLKNLSSESGKSDKALTAVANSISSIAKESGKTAPQITSFLTKFVQIEGQAKRDAAAIEFFGASAATKLIPQLEQAGTEMSALAAESTVAGTSLAAIAGPIGIAVVALAAAAIGAAALAKEIFELAKASADFQGKLFDLSQQTGVSVETLSALEVVARTTGGSIEGLAQSLGIFQKNLEAAAEDANSKAGKAFQKLGVDATDTEQALRQTIAALAKMPEGFKQTSLALEVFGRGGKQFLAIAKESKGDIDEIIRRLKDLGLVTTDQARLADEFNDQLVLLEIQLRGLGTQAIPVVLDALKDLSAFLKDNHDALVFLQGAVRGLALGISLPLKVALANLRAGFAAAQPVIKVFSDTLQAIKTAIEYINGHPLRLPGASSEGADAARKAVAVADEVVQRARNKSIQKEIEDRQKLQGLINLLLADEKRQAEERLATAQREFEAGHLTREQLLQETLLANRKKTQAEIDQLKVDRAIKVEQEKLAKDDVEKQTQISNAILAIDAEIADKRSQLEQSSRDLTAKSQLDERKDQLAHEQAVLEILTKGGEDRIARIEAEIRAGVTKREEGLRQIEEIENAALVARGQLLKRELELAGVGPERQKVLDKIAAIQNDRTELERKQSARRIAISQEETAAKADALLAEADTLQRIAQTADASRIASLRALAAVRIRSEEETEKAVLQIRLAAIDREDDLARIQNTAAKAQIEARLNAIQEARRALESQLQDAGTIEDPTKRVEEQARITKALQANVNEKIAVQEQANKDRDNLDKELNQQLRVNNAERLAIQGEGERDIEDGRQRDLDNERRYQRELKRIKEDIKDIEFDTARDVIDLMRLHFASRKDIIRAQRDLDLAEEEDRHRRASDSIKEQQGEVDTEIGIIEQHIKSIKIGTAEEIEQYERLIEELEKLRKKRAELQRQQDAEDAKHQTRKRRTKDEADREEKDADPFGKIKVDVDDIRKITKDLENSVVSSGEILKNTFLQVADAIGQVVANWVLLGETGPAVGRKILASALANIAAEAAVNAVKELAVGFALLAIGDFSGAGNAFTSAAIWASIGGVAAIAGRKVAGDLFKQKPGESGGGSGSQPNQLNPLELQRNNGTQQMRLEITLKQHVESNDSHIVKTVVEDIKMGGKTRDAINNDGVLTG